MSGYNTPDDFSWRDFHVAFNSSDHDPDVESEMLPEDFDPSCVDSEEIAEQWLQRRAKREGEMLDYWLERTDTICQ